MTRVDVIEAVNALVAWNLDPTNGTEEPILFPDDLRDIVRSLPVLMDANANVTYKTPLHMLCTTHLTCTREQAALLNLIDLAEATS